jgi:hypothetical protein
MKEFYNCFTTGNSSTDGLKRSGRTDEIRTVNLVLIQKNGDYEVEISFTEHEVTSSLASE